MALTELTTGLRRIEDAAPEIARGMAPGVSHERQWMPKQSGQGHLRVIAGRGPFQASRAWGPGHLGPRVCADPCPEAQPRPAGQGR
jgi:hypothetical protein